jgi:hypothetical protein
MARLDSRLLGSSSISKLRKHKDWSRKAADVAFFVCTQIYIDHVRPLVHQLEADTRGRWLSDMVKNFVPLQL